MTRDKFFDPANYSAAGPHLAQLIDTLRGSCSLDAYGGDSAERIGEVRLSIGAGRSYYVQAPVTRAGRYRQWRFKQHGDKTWSCYDTMEQVVGQLLARSGTASFASEPRSVEVRASTLDVKATETLHQEPGSSTATYPEATLLTRSSDRKKIANLWRDCVRISRKEFFGAADEDCAPMHLLADAATMFVGYVGPQYRLGVSPILLAVNPGGGGDAYMTRTAADELFYPLLEKFRAAERGEVVKSFERINAAFAAIVKGWNLWRILQPTLEAAHVSIQDVAFMNIVPYRTRNDRMPRVAAARTAWTRIIGPSLDVLAPSAVVAMGKKAGNLVDRLHSGGAPVYCVPRTNGDRYVSNEAILVHQKMRLELRRQG